MTHPDILWAERTGYPSWNQATPIYCGECGCELEDDVYTDEHYEYLCETCLLVLHKRNDV